MSFSGGSRSSIPLKRFVSGFKDVPPAGTATPLVSIDTYVDAVTVKADPSNSVSISIGPSGSEMFPLAAGDSVDFEMINLNLISISGTSTSNQKVFYIGGRQ
jgi:hypothetical protein